MNRLAAIFLTGFYLIATIGVAINVHYCHGEVASVNVYFAADACSCGEKMGKKHCCDDQTFLFQMEEDQQISESFAVSFNIQTPAIPVASFELAISQEESQILPFRSPDPPPPRRPSWLLNQSLILYG